EQRERGALRARRAPAALAAPRVKQQVAGEWGVLSEEAAMGGLEVGARWVLLARARMIRRREQAPTVARVALETARAMVRARAKAKARAAQRTRPKHRIRTTRSATEPRVKLLRVAFRSLRERRPNARTRCGGEGA